MKYKIRSKIRKANQARYKKAVKSYLTLLRAKVLEEAGPSPLDFKVHLRKGAFRG